MQYSIKIIGQDGEEIVTLNPFQVGGIVGEINALTQTMSNPDNFTLYDFGKILQEYMSEVTSVA